MKIVGHPTAEQMADASRRAAVSGYLPYVDSEISQMRSALENKMFNALAKNQLTPEMALAGWQELAILHRLLHRLETQAKLSTTTPQGTL